MLAIQSLEDHEENHTRVCHAQSSRLVASLDEETRDAGCIGLLLPTGQEGHLALLAQAGGPALDGHLGIDDPKLAQESPSSKRMGKEGGPPDAALQLLLALALLLGLGLLGLPLLDIPSGPCCV